MLDYGFVGFKQIAKKTFTEVFCSYQQQSTLIAKYLKKLKKQWSAEYMMIS